MSRFLTLYRELINLNEPMSKSSIDRQTHFASKYVAEARSTLRRILVSDIQYDFTLKNSCYFYCVLMLMFPSIISRRHDEYCCNGTQREESTTASKHSTYNENFLNKSHMYAYQIRRSYAEFNLTIDKSNL